jgi:SPP1 gp7 family putative phage head morphogenesis protein
MFYQMLEVQRRVVRELEEWLDKQENVDEPLSPQQTRSLRHLLAGRAATITEIPTVTLAFMVPLLAEALLEGSRSVEHDFNVMRIHFDRRMPIRVVVSAPPSEGPFQERLWKKAVELVKAVRRDLIRRIVQASVEESSARALLNEWKSGVGDALFRRYRAWALSLVRTETARAYAEAKEAGIEEAAKKHPGLERKWDATIDARTCPVCRMLHGVVAKIGAEFAPGIESPPAHPNCRCRVVPWLPSWDGETLFEEILNDVD